MDFSLSDVKDVATIISTLILPVVVYLLSKIRGHLDRIEKMEADIKKAKEDVNVAHKRIRRVARHSGISFDEDSEDGGDLCERCPLAEERGE